MSKFDINNFYAEFKFTRNDTRPERIGKIYSKISID